MLLTPTIIVGETPIPKTIAGLQLWLKADTGVFSDAGTTPAVNGATVQQWNDQSGNGKNATQTSASQRPTFNNNGTGTFNGLPAINFNGVNTVLLCGGNADFAAQDFTLFVVFTDNSVPTLATGAVLQKGDPASNTTQVYSLFQPIFGGLDLDFSTYSGSTNNFTQIGGSRDIQLITIKRISAGVLLNLYRNGVLSLSLTPGGALNASSTALGIGSDPVGGTSVPFQGSIQEILYYNAILSDTQRTAIEKYLMNRWQVPSSDLGNMTSKGPFPSHSAYAYRTFDGGSVLFIDPTTTEPVFTFPSTGGTGTSIDTQGISVILHNGTYYMSYEFDVVFSNSDQAAFGIASSPSLNGTWTHLTDVTINASPSINAQVWNPTFVVDDDGSVHIIVEAQNAQAAMNINLQIYIVDALNAALTSWSAPTLLMSTPAGDHCLLTPKQSINGLYNLFWEDTGNLPAWSTASSLKGPYTVFRTAASHWTGITTFAEAYYMHKVGNIWRFHFQKNPSGTTDVSTYIDNQDGTWLNWSPKSAQQATYNTDFTARSQFLDSGIINFNSLVTPAGFPAPAFNPTQLVGTQGGFWRADMGVTGSPNVTAWADQSANGNNFSLQSGQTSPTFSATGFNTSFPGITFTDNSSTGLGTTSGAVINSNTVSCIVLAKVTGSTAGARIASVVVGGSDTSLPGMTMNFQTGPLIQVFAGAVRGNGGSSFSFSENVPQAIGWIFEAIIADVVLNYATVGAATGFNSTIGSGASQFMLGLDAGANSFGGTIAYVLLTNKILSSTDLANLKAWTNANWGTSF